MAQMEKRVVTVAIVIGSDRNIALKDVNGLFKTAEIHSVRTRRAGANRKSIGGKNIANDVNFEGAFLNLRRSGTNIIELLPLEHIERASLNDPAIGYPLGFTAIDWETSKIEVAEGVALNTGSVFELTFTYTEL